MTRFVRTLGLCSFLLVVALNTSTAPVHAFDEIADAQKAILEMAKEIEAGKDVSSQAAALKKKLEDLAPLMAAYKPKARKGIGVGSGKDGVESKFIALGKRATAAILTMEKDDLIKMGYVNLAIGETTLHFAPEKPKGGKGKAEWVKHTKEMIEATKEFIEAVKGGNAAKVKSAANNVNNACNNCHSDFRD
jgi:hypothetical protein